MKKLLFAVTALAALSLLAPSTGFAQAHNQLGIYTDEVMTGTSVDAAPYTQTVVYLVLSNPYSDAMAPIDAVWGIEFQLIYPGNVTLLALDFTYPDIVDVGNGDNHIVGYSAGDPVVGGIQTIASMNFMNMDADPAYLHLAPADPASIADVMVLLAAGGVLSPLYPSSGLWADPVFAFNGTAVATEAVQLDEIKALYR